MSHHGFYFNEEYYKCPQCNENYLEEVEDSTKGHELAKNGWKCLNCSARIIIYAITSSKVAHELIRKRPEDISVELNEEVLFRSGASHLVTNKKFKHGKYSIALREYGSLQMDKDDWLNIHNAYWSGDKSKLID